MRGAPLGAAGVCALALFGCTAAIGAAGAQTIGDPGTSAVTSVGGKLGERVYMWGDESIMLGAEQEVITRTPGDACCDQWRVRGLVGFANLPLPHESAVGYEIAGLAGGARIPIAVGYTPAVDLGAQASLPIRVSGGSPPWAADSLIGTTMQFVPDVMLSELIPTERAHVRTEATLGLSIRFHFFSGTLP